MYIGKTGLIERILTSELDALTDFSIDAPVSKRRKLFTGPPGVAKTQLAADLALAAAGHPANVDKRMGTEMKVELIRDWVLSAPYRPLFGSCTVRFIDEIDATPSAAVIELRGYLDTLPRHVLFLATSNKPANELDDRLSTRFQIWNFDKVQTSVIAQHLRHLFPGIHPDRLHEIAEGADGNVRAAITDAETEATVLQYQQLAAA